VVEIIVAAVAVIVVAVMIAFLWPEISAGSKKRLVGAAVKVIGAMIFKLLLDAERELGGGTGQAKASMVVGLVVNSPFYLSLPDKVKAVIDAERIRELIDGAVADKLKPAMLRDKGLIEWLGGKG